jgi:hypothetical protein
MRFGKEVQALPRPTGLIAAERRPIGRSFRKHSPVWPRPCRDAAVTPSVENPVGGGWNGTETTACNDFCRRWCGAWCGPFGSANRKQHWRANAGAYTDSAGFCGAGNAFGYSRCACCTGRATDRNSRFASRNSRFASPGHRCRSKPQPIAVTTGTCPVNPGCAYFPSQG